MKLSNQELTDKYRPLVEASGTFKMEDVLQINHSPHPYTVGTRHVNHASKYHGGMLGEATLKAIPCAYRNCRLRYEDHTSNTVAPLKLLKNATNGEVQEALLEATKTAEADGLEGFIFIKTEFDFIKEIVKS